LLVPRSSRANLELATIVEIEQLVGVTLLLVVVDQAWVGRGRDDRVELPVELELPGVAVDHLGLHTTPADPSEGLDPGERVEAVSADEVPGAVDRTALPLVLVAPVGPGLRLAREVEVEVSRQPRRARRPAGDEAEDVGVCIFRDDRAEDEQLADDPGSEPAADVAASWGQSLQRAVHGPEATQSVADLVLEDKLVVLARS
jgi:hypothetical protein